MQRKIIYTYIDKVILTKLGHSQQDQNSHKEHKMRSNGKSSVEMYHIICYHNIIFNRQSTISQITCIPLTAQQQKEESGVNPVVLCKAIFLQGL